MTKSIQHSVCLPYFPGFYESLLSDALDHEADSFCEYEATESDREGGEKRYPEALRLTESELADLLMSASDYRKSEIKLAGYWVAAFDWFLSKELDFPATITFETMTSPKQYNFTTDQAFAFMGRGALRRLFAISKADGHKELARVLTGGPHRRK